MIPQIPSGCSERTFLAFPFSSVRWVPQLFITYASLAEEAIANMQGEYCDTHHKVVWSRKEYQGSNGLLPWGFCGLFSFLSLLERHQAKYLSKAATFLLEAWSQIMPRVLGSLISSQWIQWQLKVFGIFGYQSLPGAVEGSIALWMLWSDCCNHQLPVREFWGALLELSAAHSSAHSSSCGSGVKEWEDV